jgi:uncharacterized protein YndB with AHSA1/START domain
MNPTDKTAPSQTESISFEFDLHHAPEKVWRALSDPVLLAEWLLPVVDLQLEPGAAFTFKTQPYPGWDGTVNCRILEIEAHRKLSYTCCVPFLNTVVTFTLTPTASGTRLSLVQSGFKPDQKKEFGGARHALRRRGPRPPRASQHRRLRGTRLRGSLHRHSMKGPRTWPHPAPQTATT